MFDSLGKSHTHLAAKAHHRLPLPWRVFGGGHIFANRESEQPTKIIFLLWSPTSASLPYLVAPEICEYVLCIPPGSLLRTVGPKSTGFCRVGTDGIRRKSAPRTTCHSNHPTLALSHFADSENKKRLESTFVFVWRYFASSNFFMFLFARYHFSLQHRSLQHTHTHKYPNSLTPSLVYLLCFSLSFSSPRKRHAPLSPQKEFLLFVRATFVWFILFGGAFLFLFLALSFCVLQKPIGDSEG